jgi:hypothetical protein
MCDFVARHSTKKETVIRVLLCPSNFTAAVDLFKIAEILSKSETRGIIRK